MASGVDSSFARVVIALIANSALATSSISGSIRSGFGATRSRPISRASQPFFAPQYVNALIETTLRVIEDRAPPLLCRFASHERI